MRRFVETTSDKDDHGGPGWEYGICLWSPTTAKDGKKIYELMHAPKENDQIIHFFKEGSERYIDAFSYVDKECYITEKRPSYTDWNWARNFYRIDLKNFVRFENPFPLKEFIDTFEPELRLEIEEDRKGDILNYPFQKTITKDPKFSQDSFIGLKNGKYLSECTNQLFNLIKEIEDIENKNIQTNDKKRSTQNKENYIETKRNHKESAFFARNPKLKQEAIEIYGLNCQACGFSFEEKYGDFGSDYIECHHENPLSERPEKEWSDSLKTSVNDVKVLCSNCHRMIHHKRPALKFAELLKLLET